MNTPAPVCSATRRPRGLLALPALVLALIFAAAAPAFAVLPKALWVWNATPIVNYPEQQSLFAFCQSKGVSVLFLHTGSVFLEPAAAAGQIPVTTPQLGDFIIAAHAAGLAVHALDGDADFCLAANHAKAVARLQRAITFNYNQAPAARLDGFQWDIEPHVLPQWNSNPGGRTNYLSGFLGVTKKLTDAAKAGVPVMKIGFVLPFWYDDATYNLAYNGATKAPAYHVFDILKTAVGSHVAIMAYRDTAAASFPLAYSELQYAKFSAPAVKVWHGLETGPFEPSYITFAQEGNAALNNAIVQLETNHLPPYLPPQANVVAGVAIHAYEFYRFW